MVPTVRNLLQRQDSYHYLITVKDTGQGVRDPAKFRVCVAGMGAAIPGRVLSLKQEEGEGRIAHNSGKKPTPAPRKAREAGPQSSSRISLGLDHLGGQESPASFPWTQVTKRQAKQSLKLDFPHL